LVHVLVHVDVPVDINVDVAVVTAPTPDHHAASPDIDAAAMPVAIVRDDGADGDAGGE